MFDDEEEEGPASVLPDADVDGLRGRVLTDCRLLSILRMTWMVESTSCNDGYVIK